MKNIGVFLILIALSIQVHAQARRFVSTSWEVNFSSASIKSESGLEGGADMRFAPWLNLQFYNNIDYDHSGYFVGFSIRNIGFIYEKDNEKWKARNYALGIPLGFKFGDVKEGNFMYAGYEFEVPIHYKEKYFKDEVKERKFGVWFSNRVSPITHAGFVGYNFKSGFNLKFKYYFTEFFNKNFDNSNITNEQDLRYPGQGDPGDENYIPAREYLNVHVFYLTVSWNMFRKPEYMTWEKKEKVDGTVY